MMLILDIYEGLRKENEIIFCVFYRAIAYPP